MKTKNILPFLALVYVSIGILNAQNLKYRITTIDTKNGLSQGSVYTMQRDAAGNMWFGTQDGLNKWDGEHMTVFRQTAHKGSIKGIEIKKIITLPNGNIIVGTEECLNFYDKKTEKFKNLYFRNAAGELVKNETFPLKIIDKTLYVLLGKIGLLAYNLETNEQEILLAYNGVTSSYFSNINTTTVDDNNNIWLHNGITLSRFNIITKKITTLDLKPLGVKDPIINVISAKNTLWLCTNKELLILNLKNRKLERFSSYEKNKPIGLIYDFDFDSKGNIWLATEKNGLLIFNPKSKEFEQIANENQFSKDKLTVNEVSQVYVDPKGEIWANVDPYGINKIEILANNFNYFKLRIPLELGTDKQNFSIRCFAFDSLKNEIWLGTQQSGLWCLDYKTLKQKQALYDSKLPANTVRNLLFDKNGQLWIGTSEGLAVKKGEKVTFLPIKNTTNYTLSNFVRCLTEYKDNVWVGTENGLYSINKNSHKIANKCILAGERITMFLPVSEHEGLLGIYNGGLKRIKLNATGDVIEEEQIITNCTPISGKKLNETYWIGTSKGLIAYSHLKKRAVWIKNETNFINNFIYALETDGNHNLWMSTNKGIIKYLPKENKTVSFSLNDGLQDFEFNGYSSLKTPDGTIYFGGINGLNYFQPSEIKLPNYQTTNILKNNAPYLVPSNVASYLDKNHRYKTPEEFRASGVKLNFPSDKMPNYLYTKGEAWCHFSVKNESFEKWYLEVENTRLNSLQVWVYEREREVQHIKTGDSYPITQYKIKDPNPTFALNLEENEYYDIYIKASSSRDLKIPLKLWNESHLHEHQNLRKLVWGVFIGFILLISFYNLFLWLTIKDITYFYYMCYILMFGLFQLSIYGFGFQYFWSNAPFNEYAFLIFLNLAYIFVTLFTGKFLELESNLKYWKLIKNSILIFCIIQLITIPFFYENVFNYFSIFLSLSLTILFYYICFVFIKKRLKIIYYYALAIFFLTSASVILALQNLGIISSENQEFVLMTGSMIEITMFSLALGYKFRINVLERQRQLELRNQIAGTLHDDLAASLTSLTMFAELNKRNATTEKQKNDLNKIAAKARELLTTVREAVYEMNPKNDSHEDWMTRILGFGKEIFESVPIDFLSEIDENFDTLKLDHHKRREVFLIFKEAINNAAKYSKAQKVIFKVEKKGRNAEISLQDDGIGFEKDNSESGNGINNMKERAKKLGQATLEVHSGHHAGTRVSLLIKHYYN